MVLLEAPYVSEFLKQTVADLGQPVLDTPGARTLATGAPVRFMDEAEFLDRLASGERVYANSENGLDRILRSAGGSDLARQIEVCKDKVLFRETIAPIYPGYRFLGATPDELAALDVSGMTYPLVVKPARGFFSLGVHVVTGPAQWPGVVAAIQTERAAMNAEYPEEVVNAGRFIVEEAIQGREYAIDVYYDDRGEPVITNILHHEFASQEDVSDRLYHTSAEVMEAMLAPCTRAVADIGRACGFRNFPIHLEVRVAQDGTIIPIEANPLRFAGWCVADITSHAWGFNPYEYYFSDLRPDWPALMKARSGRTYAMVIGVVPPQVDRGKINDVDYDGFGHHFERVLDMRRIDHRVYPVSAFVFAETDSRNRYALTSILTADFSRFISLND